MIKIITGNSSIDVDIDVFQKSIYDSISLDQIIDTLSNKRGIVNEEITEAFLFQNEYKKLKTKIKQKMKTINPRIILNGKSFQLKYPNEKELEEAFELTFKTYVVDKKYISTEKFKDKKHMLKFQTYYDHIDFDPETIHIVGVSSGNVVSRYRIIKGKYLNDLFDLSIYGDKIYESGKLIIDDDFDNKRIIFAMMQTMFHETIKYGQVFCTSFNHGREFYKKLGGDEIGSFENPDFPTNPTSYVFRWDLEKLGEKHLTDPGVNKRFISQMIKPLEFYEELKKAS